MPRSLPHSTSQRLLFCLVVSAFIVVICLVSLSYIRGKSEHGVPVKSLDSPQQADADTFEVQDVARAATGLLVDDVVASGVTATDAAKYGLDKPEVVVTLYEAVDDTIRQHVLILGKQTEAKDSWYVQRKGAPWVYTVAAGKNVNSLRTEPGALLWKERKEEK